MKLKIQLRTRIVLTGLVLAALGCNAPGSVSTPTLAVTRSPATTTSIKPTNDGSPTASLPATPTQLSIITPVSADVCPSPGTATLPTAPPAFADYATTIEAFLSGGGSISDLQSTLGSWGGIDDNAGSVVSGQDLTGDGVPEVVVAVQAPLDQFPDAVTGPPGDLYIFGCASGAYELLFGDYSTPDRVTPDIVTVEDLNQNGRADLAYSTHYCGASTCSYDLHVLEWNPASSVFSEILPDVSGVPSATFTIKNDDGGTSEIVVENGGYGSVGAGPQRFFEDTYAWNGTIFALSESAVTTPSEEWFPIHYIQDADKQLEAGFPPIAITLYQQLIDLPDPQVFIDDDEIPALEAYARFRLVVAFVLNGNIPEAGSMYDSLFAEYDADPDKPGADFAAMADVFWQTYNDGQSVASACSATVDYAEANPTSFEVLNSFGYANRVYEAQDMCPFE
jgi:hypothetical protein